MTDITIEQAILSRSAGACRLLARSPGFLDDWQPEAERMAVGFGDRPERVPCPDAVFAQPFGKEHIAVVRVSDQAGPGPPLGLHFLIIPRGAYLTLWGDPFVLAERVTVAWHARGHLPALSWPADPLPRRTVGEVRKVLQQTKAAALSEDAEVSPSATQEEDEPAETALSPALLGGAQVLVDGGRLVFERSAPDLNLLRGLWTLLPTCTRCRLWPATFAFGNALGFDALVVPPETAIDGIGTVYTTEDQACEYPQGKYELNLQIAAEAGDQGELDALFGRRSSAETMRLALILILVVGVLAIATNWFQPAPPPAKVKLPKEQGRALLVTSMVGLANPWQAVSLWKARQDLWEDITKEKP
jgi:hypothetical protein